MREKEAQAVALTIAQARKDLDEGLPVAAVMDDMTLRMAGRLEQLDPAFRVWAFTEAAGLGTGVPS